MTIQWEPTYTFQMRGDYTYTREDEPEIAYERFLSEANISEWIEHVFRVVLPGTTCRIIVEVE